LIYVAGNYYHPDWTEGLILILMCCIFVNSIVIVLYSRGLSSEEYSQLATQAKEDVYIREELAEHLKKYKVVRLGHYKDFIIDSKTKRNDDKAKLEQENNLELMKNATEETK
jgi:hypothetical protein